MRQGYPKAIVSCIRGDIHSDRLENAAAPSNQVSVQPAAACRLAGPYRNHNLSARMATTVHVEILRQEYITVCGR